MSTHRFWTIAHTSKRFLVHLAQDFFNHGCQKNAAALTYMTLFAIIPLMTVVYSIFSMIPTFSGVGDQLQSLIFSHLIPESGSEVQSYLSNFSSQAKSLSGFGLVMLVVTAYFMLTNIEKTFNTIWGVERGRKGLSSFLLYWAILSIGPILLGAGLAMSTYLLSLKFLVTEYDAFGLSTVLFRCLPVVFTSTAFTLLFVAVPNCRVPMRYAVTGGVITAICFELLKNLFGLIVAKSSIHVVYGAFAAVPLFLMWINLAWVIILSGAILVRTLAERRYVITDGNSSDMVVALICLDLFRNKNKYGYEVSDADCYSVGLGVVHWQQLRGQLLKNRWISVTSGGRYVIRRDLNTLCLWDLAQLVNLKLHNLSLSVSIKPEYTWFKDYADRRSQITEYAKKTLGISIEGLLSLSNEKLSHESP